MSDVNGPGASTPRHEPAATAELPTVPGPPPASGLPGHLAGPAGAELSALTASVAVPAAGEEYQVPPWLAGGRPPAVPAAPPLVPTAPTAAPPPASPARPAVPPPASPLVSVSPLASVSPPPASPLVS